MHRGSGSNSSLSSLAQSHAQARLLAAGG
jgi:hypothetical protein